MPTEDTASDAAQIYENLSELNPRVVIGGVLATSLAANAFLFYRFAQVRNENIRLADQLQEEVTKHHAKRLI